MEAHPPERNLAVDGRARRRIDWKTMLGNRRNTRGNPSSRTSISDAEQPTQKRPAKWNMGMMNDQETEEVPGSVLLLSKLSEYNEPLGLQNAPARTSASSLPSPYRTPSHRSSFSRRKPPVPEKKRTADGKIILEPQPDDSLNDPLNWRAWRRDLALLSLGFYCMVGGGMTPILAAGFDEVAADFNISTPTVALSTGLYMMGLGIGSAILAPTAILFGKRPVYLCAAICFILSSVWCALSPNFPNLIVARIFMGIAVSSVECLPSATVAEIFFLHEKAYRLGIYTLLLLGGKNLVPLVSAAVIQSLHWRWVFWIVAMIVGLGFVLLFFFVPETFWDRTPRPRKHTRGLRRLSSAQNIFRRGSSPIATRTRSATVDSTEKSEHEEGIDAVMANRRAHFQPEEGQDEKSEDIEKSEGEDRIEQNEISQSYLRQEEDSADNQLGSAQSTDGPVTQRAIDQQMSQGQVRSAEPVVVDYFNVHNAPLEDQTIPSDMPNLSNVPTDVENQLTSTLSPNPYTEYHREQPPRSFWQQLRPYSGRLTKDKWLRVAARPFILFCYPSILWSALVYSLSIGWLIVLSESLADIYENRETYNFDSLQAGLVYISPFVGGILGTVVAGKVSDLVVRYMARRNGGIYEPEFRLVMGIPIAIFTTIGLMGYGWSAQERDHWIIPTVFFGFISFGCSLGSTTSITFAVDSYRQYAGEALVTLNFSKNIFHGLVFSLFFNRWLDAEGSKDVFIAIGGIQLACLLTTIPMYIYGKRARMWTVRKNMMERF